MMLNVRALVVARLREIAQGSRFFSLLAVFISFAWPLGATFRFGLDEHHYFTMWTLIAAGYGWNAGAWAGAFGRVLMAAWEVAGTRARGDALRVLPTSPKERLVATTIIAALLASPTAVAVLLSGLVAALRPHSTRTSMAPLAIGVAVYVAAFTVGVAWKHPSHGRVRAPFMRPLAWLAKRRPSRGSEVSSATWVLVPGLTMGPLFTFSLLLIVVLAAGGNSIAWLGAAPGAWVLPASVVCVGSLGSAGWLQALVAPLARLSVSRRSLAWAELRMVPMRLVVSGVSILAIVPGVVRDPSLARTVAQLLVLAACVDAAVSVMWARMVVPSFRLASMWQTSSTMTIFGATAFLAALVLDWAPAPVAPLILGAISACMATLAVALAYTTPNTPLSREPGGLTSAVLRKVGVL